MLPMSMIARRRAGGARRLLRPNSASNRLLAALVATAAFACNAQQATPAPAGPAATTPMSAAKPAEAVLFVLDPSPSMGAPADRCQEVGERLRRERAKMRAPDDLVVSVIA